MEPENREFWSAKHERRTWRLPWRRDTPGRRENFGAGGFLNVIVIVLALGTVFALVLLWPGKAEVKRIPGLDFFNSAYQARVVSASSEECQGADPTQPVQCVTVRARLLEGPDKGTTTTLQFPSPSAGTHFGAGDRIYVVRTETGPGGPGAIYSYLDHARLPSLWWLAGLFAVAVVALGRLRGVGALIGLAASFFILMRFMLPAILEGRDPLLIAIVSSCAIAFVALYLAQGLGKVTTIALLGTIGALAITAVLGFIWVRLASFTGLGSEEAFVVQLGAAQVDLVGLLLAGIVIGALGALDDMTVTQAAAVEELRRANPTMSRKAVYRSGLRIGRDHVASIVNTLVLAYAGASLPLLLVFVISKQSSSLIINSEAIAVEIVRALVGSIGLIASVPLTTWLATYLMPPDTTALATTPRATTGPTVGWKPQGPRKHRVR